MTKHPIPVVFTLVLGLLLQVSAAAVESREITWDDLIPAEAEFDDAFTRLDEDTIFELSMVASVRDRIDRGQKVDETTLANYKQRIIDLEDQGVDVDGLLGMREAVAREREAKLNLTNGELDGRQVRIPGYLLPLEFEGDKVTEFFLVPYVGACIHTPPPPPNQIVHVTPEQAVEASGGLYMPVWVDGTIRTERSESNLSLVDGSSEIPSGYMLDAVSVVPYE